MAERSFTEEVQKLKLGEGDEFHGEGILAVTKALLQSGVSYVAGYQGAPISHLMDVLADANDILESLGVHFENSASEATAAATLAASVNYPLRGAVTFKSTVGTNVASDALANLASGGVTGGALIIIGEDYGEGSSIMQERVHAFAMKSQMWLIDPRPNLPSIVRAVETAFELSEISNTPVMLELRIRACHVYGRFTTKANKRPDFGLTDALENPRRDLSRIAMPPMVYTHEKDKWEKRLPAAVKYIQDNRLNEFFDGDANDIGIVVQGGLYNTTLRGLELLGLADSFGDSKVPIYCLNVTYPLVDAEFVRFCAGKKAILIVEEGQPDYIEQAVNTILRRADVQTKRPRQGHAADGRRIHRRRGARRHRQVRREGAARSSFCGCRGSKHRAGVAAGEQGAGRGGRQGARPTAIVLHRLSGAANLRRDETGRARTGPAPCERRHRLPSVLDLPAVQRRRHHDGLRARRRRRLRAQREGRQARHLDDGRRRLLA